MLALGRVLKRPRPCGRLFFFGSAGHSQWPTAAESHPPESDGLPSVVPSRASVRTSTRKMCEAPYAAAASGQNGFRVEQQRPQLKLMSGSSLQAAPTKLNPLGEDAYFVSNDGAAIGVADGIGAWKQDNIDSGIYARELMKNAKSYFDSQSQCTDPKKAMQIAYQLTEKHGTCTACILSLNGEYLRAANLGDTGFLILRPLLHGVQPSKEQHSVSGAFTRPFDTSMLLSEDVSWKLNFKSFEMQYFFNCPVQVGTGTRHTPQNVAETMQLPVRQGDLVITATDGVFDNLFINDIKALIARVAQSVREEKHGSTEIALDSWLEHLAKAITLNAIRTGLSSSMKTPFALQARRAGFIYSGGKVDDSTVVVSLVIDEK